jgi:hypothetical protein
MYPPAAYLPFNRESLVGEFVPGKNGEPPENRGGTWLLVQENVLWVQEASGERGWRLPQGPLPEDFARTLDPIVHLGTYRGAPCWAAAVPSGVEVPAAAPDPHASVIDGRARFVAEHVDVARIAVVLTQVRQHRL